MPCLLPSDLIEIIQPVVERDFGDPQDPAHANHLEAVRITQLISLPPADTEDFSYLIHGICSFAN